jgi:hypothetical protein
MLRLGLARLLAYPVLSPSRPSALVALSPASYASSALQMARETGLDITPPPARGMRALDRAAFRRAVRVLAARVPPAQTAAAMRAPELRRCVRRVRCLCRRRRGLTRTHTQVDAESAAAAQRGAGPRRRGRREAAAPARAGRMCVAVRVCVCAAERRRKPVCPPRRAGICARSARSSRRTRLSSIMRTGLRVRGRAGLWMAGEALTGMGGR